MELNQHDVILIAFYILGTLLCISSSSSSDNSRLFNHNQAVAVDAIFTQISDTPTVRRAKNVIGNDQNINNGSTSSEVHVSNNSYLYPYEEIYGQNVSTFTRSFESGCKRCLRDFGKGQTNSYDYPGIKYPIPFSILYNDYKSHYYRYGEPDPRFPDFIHLGDVQPDAFSNADYIVVTGCSDNHVLPTINLLYSIVYSERHASIVLVDYNLSEANLKLLVKELTNIHQIHQNLNSKAQLYYRKFNFHNFPDWWSLSDREVRGGYSWKVVSYFDVLNQTRRMVTWTDGGVLWKGSIRLDKRRAVKNGMYTGQSSFQVGKWVHASSRNFLVNNGMTKQVSLKKSMCIGGYVWFDPSNQRVMNEMVYPLVQCAYTRKCISPLNTGRKNHRQDQAILTMFVHSVGIKESCSRRFPPTPAFYQDCKGEKCESIKDSLKKQMMDHLGKDSLKGVN